MKSKTREEACLKLAEALLDCFSTLAVPEPISQEGPRLYSPAELAKRFGKSKDTIRRWMAEGEFGEILQTGSSVMVTEDGLQKYIADHSGSCKKRVRKPKGRTVMTSRGPAERI